MNKNEKAKLLREIADRAAEFSFLRDIEWWRTSTKKEISGEGLREFARTLREEATQLESVPEAVFRGLEQAKNRKLTDGPKMNG